MHLGSRNGPLSLSLTPSEGERVPFGRVRAFRGAKRERAVRGRLSAFILPVVLRLLCAGGLNAAAPKELSHYNVVWDTPSHNAAGSMQIGRASCRERV